MEQQGWLEKLMERVGFQKQTSFQQQYWKKNRPTSLFFCLNKGYLKKHLQFTGIWDYFGPNYSIEL